MNTPNRKVPETIAKAPEDAVSSAEQTTIAERRAGLHFFVPHAAEVGSTALGAAVDANGSIHLCRVEVVETGVGRYGSDLERIQPVAGNPAEIFTSEEWRLAIDAIRNGEIPLDLPQPPPEQGPIPPTA